MVLSRGARRLLDTLRWWSKWFGSIYPGQRKLAETLGVVTRTVQRWLSELAAAGLVAWKRRGYRRTNEYQLSTTCGQECRINVASVVTPSSDQPSGISYPYTRERLQHHLPEADDAVRKTAGMERLSEGDRRWLAGLRRSGTAESAIRAGILVGRARKLASRSASEPIRSLRYFAQTIAEAPALPNGYLEHIENRLRRLA